MQTLVWKTYCTCDNLAKAVQGVHMTFGITDKVVGTTTDNGSNFVKVFK